MGQSNEKLVALSGALRMMKGHDLSFCAPAGGRRPPHVSCAAYERLHWLCCASGGCCCCCCWQGMRARGACTDCTLRAPPPLLAAAGFSGRLRATHVDDVVGLAPGPVGGGRLGVARAHDDVLGLKVVDGLERRLLECCRDRQLVLGVRVEHWLAAIHVGAVELHRRGRAALPRLHIDGPLLAHGLQLRIGGRLLNSKGAGSCA